MRVDKLFVGAPTNDQRRLQSNSIRCDRITYTARGSWVSSCTARGSCEIHSMTGAGNAHCHRKGAPACSVHANETTANSSGVQRSSNQIQGPTAGRLDTSTDATPLRLLILRLWESGSEADFLSALRVTHLARGCIFYHVCLELDK